MVKYSHPEHLHTKPNVPKCIRYGTVDPGLCELVDQERIRGMLHRCGSRVGREVLSRVPRAKLYWNWLNNQAGCSLN